MSKYLDGGCIVQRHFGGVDLTLRELPVRDVRCVEID